MKQQLLETNETIVVDHYAGGHKPWSRDIDEWRQVEKKGAVKVGVSLLINGPCVCLCPYILFFYSLLSFA